MMTEKITAEALRIDPATLEAQTCEKTETGSCGECPVCSDEMDAERDAIILAEEFPNGIEESTKEEGK